MHFGENQLSRGLIGLSPLPTAHPPHFQLRRVRSSTRSYTCFNLAMGRSPRFGSAPRHWAPHNFGLAVATAPPRGLTSRRGGDSQAHSSIGTPSLSLRLLVDIRFQVLFHSPPGVLFTFPSRYYALSVTGSYLALEGGPSCFPPDSSCPVVLWYQLADSTFRIRASYPLWKSFPELFS